MAKLLIVGATGFVGRELCAQALARGDQPVALAPDAAEVELPPGTEPVVGDVTDPASVRRTLEQAAPDGVVHMASFGIGGSGLLASADVDRLKAVEVNVLGFLVMAEAVLDVEIPRMVWASSLAVYGGTGTLEQRLDEEAPTRPDTFYGATKATCEMMARPLFSAARERFTSIRLPTVYGAGRYPGAQAELVRFVEDIAAGRPAHLSASNDPFDWIHVQDAAGILLDVANRTCQDQLYNVVGHTAGIATMGREAAKHATAAADVEEQPSSATPPLMDDDRARAQLGFEPRYVLENGVAQYVDEMRSVRS